MCGEIVGRFGKEKQTYTRKHILTHSTPKTGEKGKFRRRKGEKWSNKLTLIFSSYLHSVICKLLSLFYR